MTSSKWLVAGMVLTSLMFMGGCASSGGGGAEPVVQNQATAALTSAIPPGAVCANGGILVETGIDTNGNGLLDAAEILNSQPVCNGTNGTNGSNGSNGADGTNTGINGTNGVDGTNGTNGTNGLSTLMLLTDATPAECTNGGVRVDVGVDSNGNIVLDPAEIAQTKLVCNGEAAAATLAVETCTLCHAPGKIADVQSVHAGNNVIQVTANIDSFTVSGGFATINFTVRDASGNPLPGLKVAQASNATRLQYFRIGYVQLKAGATANDPNTWVSLTNGDRTFANLTDNGNGTYTYVSTTAIPTYDPALVTRVLVIVQTGDKVPAAYNATLDIPGTGPVLTRNVVTTAACNSCHGTLGSPLGTASFHGGARNTSEACTVCHITTLGGGVAYYPSMVHKIHAAKDLLPGDPGWDFTKVTYPQDLRNCTTCHAATDTYWTTMQSAETCFNNCHDATVTGANVADHAALTSADSCTDCHALQDVATIHRTENATPHNPAVPAGLVNFTYAIDSVTVDAGNNAIITFHIQKDGVDLDLGIGAPVVVPTGFTGGPAFLFAYALPQNGIAAPADYNNLGKAAGQPASVNVVGLTLTGTPAAYVATIPNGFPAGATLRSVAMQGYFTQAVGTGGIAVATGRHTQSVQKAVTGDTVRRTIVSQDKCLGCHEIFEGHGGSRVNNPQVCVFCHNPNLSSSGRTGDPAKLDLATTAMFGNNPLIFPEASNNLKDMIHGIHSAENPARVLPFQFVRIRSNTFYPFDWSEVGFPGILSNCQTCHNPGTYDAELPAGVLMTTSVTSNGTDPMTRAAVTASRNTVPNATDEVISPVTASCSSCHADAGLQKAHMQQNGGAFDLRKNLPLAQ